MLSTHLRWYHVNMNERNKSIRKAFLSSSGCRYYPDSRETKMVETDLKKVRRLLRRYERMNSLRYRIVFLRDTCEIENNYPHTHADVIFFPSMYFEMVDAERVRLLIHEMIHVYQRYFPIPYHKMLIEHFGYEVHSLRATNPHVDRVRSNPDVNGLLYSSRGKYMLPILHEGAKSIRDVSVRAFDANTNEARKSLDGAYGINEEHVNEVVAYYLENRIKDGTLSDELRAFL